MRNQASLGRWRPAVTTTTGPKDSPSVNIWHADHPRYPICCMHQRRVWILHSLVTTDTKSVEAFYMKCQRHILVVRWLDHSKQRSCNSHVNPSPLLDLIIKRRNTFFGNAWSDRSLTTRYRTCTAGTLNFWRQVDIHSWTTLWSQLETSAMQSGPKKPLAAGSDPFRQHPACSIHRSESRRIPGHTERETA